MKVQSFRDVWGAGRWKGPAGILVLAASSGLVVAMVALGLGPGDAVRGALVGPGRSEVSARRLSPADRLISDANDDAADLTTRDAFLPYTEETPAAPAAVPVSGADSDASGPAQDAPAADPRDTLPGLNAAVTGRVVHEVWGTPIADVRVSVAGSGLSAYTAEDGTYFIGGIDPESEPCVVRVDLDEGTWRTRRAEQVSVTLVSGGASVADFQVYAATAADAGTLRPVGWWRSQTSVEDAGSYAVALTLVGGASRQFAGLDANAAHAILAGGGDERSKARASLLALWLSMASADVGPDAQFDVSGVRGWESVAVSAGGEGHTSALDLARDVEAMFACQTTGDDVWRAARQCTSAGPARPAAGATTRSGR